MSRKSLTVAVIVLAFSTVGISNALAVGITNGDFETNDLTGWTGSAVKAVIPLIPVTPLISVSTVSENSFAVLETGEFATGPFISTLEQTFVLPVDALSLNFDFSFFTAPDSTGAGTSLFLDAFTVTLTDGLDFFDLLLVDSFGPLINPFGTAPGPIALTVPPNAFFDLEFSADLTSLGGKNVTLFFDLISEDDGAATTVFLDNLSMTTTALIPEPATGILLSSGLLGLVLWRWHRKNSGATSNQT